MNALNRLALTPDISEDTEIALERLAGYLAATSAPQRGAPLAEWIERALHAHWELATTLRPGPNAPLAFSLAGDLGSLDAGRSLTQALQQALRPYERADLERLQVHVTLHEDHESRGSADIVVSAHHRQAGADAEQLTVSRAQWLH